METNSARAKKGTRKSSTVDIGSMVYGKVPPQSKDIEEVVIGAIMLEKDVFDTAATILKKECFYVDAHQRIFASMQSLQQKNQPIDIRTVIEELKTREDLEVVGGPYFVTRLTNAVASTANMEAYCRIILQKFLQRELIRISGEIIGEAYEDSTDVFDLLDKAEERILSVGNHISGESVQIDSVLVKAMTKIGEWREQDSAITGVPSGFATLDKSTRGWQNGDLIIVAARPSVGKTAFALNLVKAAAKEVPVAVWSLEMAAVQLILRMLAAESEINLHKIQTGRLDDDQMKTLYSKGVQSLSGKRIYFDDNPGLNLFTIRAKARRMKKKNNIGLIIIDYLQLMEGHGDEKNREREIAKISRGLKLLAKELGVPIIALSQLSREVEKRKGGIPQLSDLRESGAIEQDADVIMFLWGPTDEDVESDAGLITKRYLRIAKQRNGVLVKMDLDFRNEIQLMTETEKEFTRSKVPAELGKGSWKPVPDDRANLFNPGSRD